MILENYYWYFTNVIPKKTCEDIIKFANNQKDKLATTGKFSDTEKLTKKQLKDLKKSRDSNVIWLNEPWVYNEITPWIHQANISAKWNFKINWFESCQFTKYKLNQFYDWHPDSFSVPYNNKDNNFNGKIRKLSVTVSLSDPKDYKGGELEFDFRNNDNGKPNIKKCTEILPQGSVVVFPSFVWHRVKPVTEGTRYSLVIWSLGDPFV
jgi:PKHD-type hydroxylase